MANFGHLIVYQGGHRIDKRIHVSRLKDAAVKVKQLKAKGVKAHLAWRTDERTYPPPHQIAEMRDQGQLWCPYCRAWRWFTVPRFVRGTEVGTDEWFMNSMHRQGIKVCKWCQISIFDFWVCNANGIFAEVYGARRRKKKRRSR